jgi:small-conductance mechanosensitive channel
MSHPSLLLLFSKKSYSENISFSHKTMLLSAFHKFISQQVRVIIFQCFSFSSFSCLFNRNRLFQGNRPYPITIRKWRKRCDASLWWCQQLLHVGIHCQVEYLSLSLFLSLSLSLSILVVCYFLLSWYKVSESSHIEISFVIRTIPRQDRLQYHQYHNLTSHRWLIL